MLRVLNTSDQLPPHSRQSWLWTHLLDTYEPPTKLPSLVAVPAPFVWMGTNITCEGVVNDVDDSTIPGESYNILKLKTRTQHLRDAYVLLFTCDLYGRLGSVLNNANFVGQASRARLVCDGYPKTHTPQRADVGLVAYDVTDKYILVHHTQINGIAAGSMTGNQVTRFCRSMIRSLVSVSSLPVVAPTIELIRRVQAPLAFHAYNSSVFTHADGFKRRPLHTIPMLHEALETSNVVPETTPVWYHE